MIVIGPDSPEEDDFNFGLFWLIKNFNFKYFVKIVNYEKYK